MSVSNSLRLALRAQEEVRPKATRSCTHYFFGARDTTLDPTSTLGRAARTLMVLHKPPPLSYRRGRSGLGQHPSTTL